MSNAPVHVNDADFQKVVLESNLPVVVDFWAAWCGPCKAIAPSLEKLAGEYAGKLVVAKMNVDENEVPTQFGIQGIPTLLFFNGGRMVNQKVGALPYPALKQLFDRFLTQVAQPVQATK